MAEKKNIISQNRKSIDEDEYALNDGPESRRLVKALPETTVPNGPPSCKVKLVRQAGQE